MKSFYYILFVLFCLPLYPQKALASYPDTNIRTISVGSAPTSIASTTYYLFVTNSFDNTVSIIDLATYSVEKTIDVGNNPLHIISKSDSSNVYVSNYDDDSISVISVASLTVTATISGVGDGPSAMCLSSTDDTLYVTCKGDDSLTVISTGSNSVTRRFTSIGDAPNYPALSSSGDDLYVTLENESAVVLIDLIKNEVTSTKIAVGSNPAGLAVTPNSNYIFAANLASDSISRISTSSRRVIQTISNAGDGVKEVMILNNGQYAFVTNSNSNNLTVINVLDDTIAATLTVESSPYGITASDDDQFIYIANKGSNSVTVIEDQSSIEIDSVDSHYLNDSATARITWHTADSGTYQIETGGIGTKGTGTIIFSGSVTANVQNTADIVATTHLLSGDTSYKIYVYLTITGGTVYSDSVTLILDNNAPAVPVGLTSEFGDGKIILNWDTTIESDLDGYKVYYGTATATYGTPMTIDVTDSYTLAGLTNEVTYFITLAAFDLAGNESVKSSEIKDTPNKILSLAELKGEKGCFIAEASYEEGGNDALKRSFNRLLNMIRAGR